MPESRPLSNTFRPMSLPVSFPLFLSPGPSGSSYLKLQSSNISGAGISPSSCRSGLEPPHMLVIRNVMGTKKTLWYVGLVVTMAALSGMVFGRYIT